MRLFLAPAGARLLATRAKAAKAAPGCDLGWDQLKKELLDAPLVLPRLKKIDLKFGRSVDGNTGARRFHKNHFAALRYQNPELIVTSVGSKEVKSPTVLLELKSGETAELDVKGERQVTILRRVLAAAGAAAEQVERATEAAEAQEQRQQQLREEKVERFRKLQASRHETWSL